MKSFKLKYPFLFVLVFSFVIFTVASCEKEDIPTNNIENDGLKLENLAVDKDLWKQYHGYWEVKLPSKWYNSNNQYEFIYVYERVDTVGSFDEMWKKLPYANSELEITDFNIYVKKYCDLTEDKYFFLIEMKLVEEE